MLFCVEQYFLNVICPKVVENGQFTCEKNIFQNCIYLMLIDVHDRVIIENTINNE